MRRFKYIRVSSGKTQNVARQLDNSCEMFIDKISGTIPFHERPQASKLLDALSEGDTLEIESVDRIGRTKIDMLNVLEELKNRKVIVYIKNLGIQSFLESGKYNFVFDIISTLLSSLAEGELIMQKERVEQGVAIAKALGKYKGRRPNSSYTRSQYLERNAESVKIIKKHSGLGLSLRELAKLTGVSHVKVKKIKEML